MPRKPDIPCVECGKLTWGGKNAAPPERRRCKACFCGRPASVMQPPPAGPYRICAGCRTPYEPARHAQRFCSAKCREAKLGTAKRSRSTKKGTTASRGYGSRHQAERKRWTAVVAAGAATCWRCGEPIQPGTPWDLGHDDYDRSVYRGPEHRSCNRSAGAAKGNRERTGNAPSHTSWRW